MFSPNGMNDIRRMGDEVENHAENFADIYFSISSGDAL
jgi:hypothetical protein